MLQNENFKVNTLLTCLQWKSIYSHSGVKYKNKAKINCKNVYKFVRKNHASIKANPRALFSTHHICLQYHYKEAATISKKSIFTFVRTQQSKSKKIYISSAVNQNKKKQIIKHMKQETYWHPVPTNSDSLSFLCLVTLLA